MNAKRTAKPVTMWAGLATTTIAAVITLLLCMTGLPDALTVPVLGLLLAAMVGGVVADVVVRARWRSTTRKQRTWLSSLSEDLPGYRARVEERERVLYGVESRWYRPLGTVFLVALGAALVPFNLLLPLAPEQPVEALVSGWVAVSLLLTGALVVRTVGAARADSRGLVVPPPVAPPAPVAHERYRSEAEIVREESVAKYLVVEEEVSPEVLLAREIERLTRLIDDPQLPQPSLPVPASWIPQKPVEPTDSPLVEPVETTDPPLVEPAETDSLVEPAETDSLVEPVETRSDETQPAETPEPARESELAKFSKFFHAA